MSQFDLVAPPHRCARARAVRTLSLHLAVAAVLLISAGLLLGAVSDVIGGGDAEPEKDNPDQVWLRVSDDGSELDYAGPIVFGVKKRVRALLDEHPRITTLRLSSPGGRVVEARDLSEMIRARNLMTIAVGNCASACTVVFMAGRERLLAPTTTLGFHRYRSPDKDQREAEENMAIDRDYFRARGIPDWFIERAFTTPNVGMWRPSLDEMKVANVITAELTAGGERVPAAEHGATESLAAVERNVGSGATRASGP